MELVGSLTVSAGLHGRFNIADALHCNAVLVIAVDKLVLELSNLVDQDTQLISYVGDILITVLTPEGKLLL